MHFSVLGVLVDDPQEKTPRLPVDVDDTGIELINGLPDSIMILRQRPALACMGQSAAGKVKEGVRTDTLFGDLREMNIS